MKRIILFIVLFTSVLYSQENSSLQEIRIKYESFEYEEVVRLAERLILTNENLSDEELIELYELKAASHFATDEEDAARASFIELLKIEPEYELSSTKFSPKIIDFFNQVKFDYNEIVKNLEENNTTTETVKDTVKIVDYDLLKIQSSFVLSGSVKSILLPGLGHLHFGDNTKGWILTTASTAALGSMLYFIFDTNQKENEYLKATDPILIKEKYDEYNSSYQIRNALIISYAALWLYSQLDLFLFNNDLLDQPYIPQVKSSYPSNEMEFSFSIPLN